MSTDVAQGAFNVEDGGATVGSTVDIVTGLPSAPTFMLFYTIGRTESVDADGGQNHKKGFGAALGTADRRCIAAASDDADASTNASCAGRVDACIAWVNALGAVAGLMDVNSWGTTVQLIIDQAFTSDIRVFWLAIGGDVNNAVIGAQIISSTGDLVVSGLSFAPVGTIFFATNNATDANSILPDSAFMVGAATGVNNEAVVSGLADDGGAAGNSNTGGYGFGEECVGIIAGTSNAVVVRADMKSFNSDGWTLNVREVGATRAVFYVTWGGGQAEVRDFLTQTNTSNFSQTGVGFQPVAAMFLSSCRAEDAADVRHSDDLFSIGVAVSSTDRGAMAMADPDALASSEVSTHIQYDEVYIHPDEADGFDGLMDLVSFDSDGYTNVMDDADVAQNFVIGVVWGDNAAAAAEYLPPDQAHKPQHQTVMAR